MALRSDDVLMMVRDAQRTLMDLASQHGLDLASLDPSEAVDIMIHWYETMEAVDAAPNDEDGDALLFQWRSFEFEHPRTFQYDITRQMIWSDGDEQVVWQLSLTLHYEPTPESENLRGDKEFWCLAKADIPTWRAAVQASAATSYVTQRRPWQVGEVFPANMTPADQHDAADQMQNRWRDYTGWHDTDDEFLLEAERTAITAPFGRDWPGLCPNIALQGPPEHFADCYAEFLHDDRTRLGLVAVERAATPCG